MNESLQGLFGAFEGDPSPANFIRLREAVIAEPAYNPWADDLREAARLLGAGEAERAKEALVPVMANYLLSPRACRLLADIYGRLGDEANARHARDLAAICLRALAASGDGTADRPHLVLRVTDEYDVLGFLGKRWVRQSLRERGGRTCDVFEVEGGGEVWFDITEAHRRMGGPFRA
jgi:hypothetical protein